MYYNKSYFFLLIYFRSSPNAIEISQIITYLAYNTVPVKVKNYVSLQ